MPRKKSQPATETTIDSRRLKIEYWPVEKLVEYSRNPRKNDDVIGKIVASISEFGFTVPILAKSDGLVIDGHLRLKGARNLGMKEVPVIVCDTWTEAQVKAFRLLANRSVSWAQWDEELLAIEFSELEDLGFDLELTGFTEDEIESYKSKSAEGNPGLCDEEETPEPPAIPVSIAGDIWVLGKHRVLCGDSTVATDVEKLLGDVKPHLMITDPPYGVEYDANWRNERTRLNGKKVGARATGKVSNDDRADWTETWSLFPGHIAYVWHAALHAAESYESLTKAEFNIRAQIIWAKSNFAISRGDYHWQHEPCWYAVKGTGKWTGDRSQTTLWKIDKPQKSETGHSTQKPVECMRRPMLNNSSPGQAVYDPFLGSGTTVIAAEQEGRACYGIELNPAYVDVIVERWQKFSGKPAIHIDGTTFIERQARMKAA